MEKKTDNYIKLVDFLKSHPCGIDFSSETEQLEGALKCLKNSFVTTLLNGGEECNLPELTEMIFKEDLFTQPKGNGIIHTPIYFSYGVNKQILLVDDNGKTEVDKIDLSEAEKYNCVEVTLPDSILKYHKLIVVTLMQNREEEIFCRLLPVCDNMILAVNFEGAIGQKERRICDLIKNRWQQPERVSLLALDIGGFSLPGVMLSTLAHCLGSEKELNSYVTDNIDLNEENCTAVRKLFCESVISNKENVLERALNSAKNAPDKISSYADSLDKELKQEKQALERLNILIASFESQIILNESKMNRIFDEDMKRQISNDILSFIIFMQNTISQELRDSTSNKDEIDAYLPYYYNYLLQTFSKQLSSEIIIPKVQLAFDEILSEIKSDYENKFGEPIPDELLKKTKVSATRILAVDDRTKVQLKDPGNGLMEGILFGFFVYLFCNSLIFVILDTFFDVSGNAFYEFHKIKRKIIGSLKTKTQHEKEVNKHVRKSLDENADKLNKQFVESLFPAINSVLYEILENFIHEACWTKHVEKECMEKRLTNIESNLTKAQDAEKKLRSLLDSFSAE